MQPTPIRRDPRSRARSLASISQGETLEVGDILFDGVRALCETAGIRPGIRVRCCDASPSQLLLETEAGRVTSVERRWAAFVEATELLGGARGTRLTA